MCLAIDPMVGSLPLLEVAKGLGEAVSYEANVHGLNLKVQKLARVNLKPRLTS